MATAKVIKGATRMVEKVVCVEEKQPDTYTLTLSQEELDAVVFILGRRYAGYRGDAAYTGSVYWALAPFRENPHKNLRVVGRDNAYKVVHKNITTC